MADHMLLRNLAASGRLIFGLGALHHLPLPSSRRALVTQALDLGFRAFDTAPAYGNGLSEQVLGDVLGMYGAPNGVQIHSKVGIPITIYPTWSGSIFGLFRVWDRIRKDSARAYARRDFDPVSIRASLEASLKRLGVDCLDVLFLHEPLQPLALEVVAKTFVEFRAEGLIRQWGIAGPMGHYTPTTLPPGLLIQQPAEEWLAMPEESRRRDAILFGLASAWRNSGTDSPFSCWVGDLAMKNESLRFVVATRQRDRLRTWFEETA